MCKVFYIAFILDNIKVSKGENLFYLPPSPLYHQRLVVILWANTIFLT